MKRIPEPIDEMFVPKDEDTIFQLHLRENKWAFFVACILLNQTTGVQVNRVIHKLFKKWPTPPDMADADPEEVEEVIRSLGLQRRRARTLKKFSRDFMEWDGEDPRDMFGIGRYAFDSWEIFYHGRTDPDSVTDKVLTRYLRQLQE